MTTSSLVVEMGCILAQRPWSTKDSNLRSFACEHGTLLTKQCEHDEKWDAIHSQLTTTGMCDSLPLEQFPRKEQSLGHDTVSIISTKFHMSKPLYGAPGVGVVLFDWEVAVYRPAAVVKSFELTSSSRTLALR